MSNEQCVPWTYKGEVVTGAPEGTVGMVYLITRYPSVNMKEWITIRHLGMQKCNVVGLKEYVGRKLLVTNRRKRIGVREKASTKTRKTFKVETKDSNWLQYSSSCKPLQMDIKTSPELYTKEILHWVYNKKQASYYEVKEQLCRGLLEVDSWVDNVAGRWFRKDLIRKE